MDFGIHIGTRGCLTSRENVMAVAQRAEALGYAYLGVSDHLIVPVQSAVRYPYTADGRWPARRHRRMLRCIATLAFLAGCTQRIKLLTSVVVVPYRPAVLAAKLFLTADVLSGGRVIAGVGVGWMPEEFAALGTPPIRRAGRGDRRISGSLAFAVDRRDGRSTTASMPSSTMCCSRRSRHHGRRLPIWVGGESAPALRRTVKYGDAWYPASNNQDIQLNTPARLQKGIERLHRVAEKRRPRSFIDRCRLPVVCPAYMGYESEVPSRGSCSAAARMTCWPTQPPWRKPAARHAIFYVQRPTIEETLDVIQRFGEEVVRKA